MWTPSVRPIASSSLGRGCRPDGSAYTFSTANPFKQTVQLDRAVTGNMHTGYALPRKKDSEADSKYTPYFYVWTKSIDESKDQASQFGGGELKNFRSISTMPLWMCPSECAKPSVLCAITRRVVPISAMPEWAQIFR